jgi:hypothetical protein
MEIGAMRTAMIVAVALAAAGCGGEVACHAEFTGNFTAEVDPPAGCGTMSKGTGAQASDWILELRAMPNGGKVSFDAQIDVGPAPAAGMLSSQTTAHWQAVAVTDANCELSAGNQSTPGGAFTLTLTSVTGLDKATATAHGTLLLTQALQAPSGVDCGFGDTESVYYTF